jgi:hypothetical protein
LKRHLLVPYVAKHSCRCALSPLGYNQCYETNTSQLLQKPAPRLYSEHVLSISYLYDLFIEDKFYYEMVYSQ